MKKKRLSLEEKKLSLQEKYKKQVAQLNSQIKAQQARERQQERKEDTRRKIFIGALAGHHMEKNPNSDFAKKMASLIDEYVIKDNDRALFDLPALPKEEQDIRLKQHAADRKKQNDIESL